MAAQHGLPHIPCGDIGPSPAAPRGKKRRRYSSQPSVKHVFRGKHSAESGHIAMGMQEVLFYMDSVLRKALAAQQVQQWSQEGSKATLGHLICDLLEARSQGSGSAGRHTAASTMAIACMTGLKPRTVDRILSCMHRSGGSAKPYGGRGGRPPKVTAEQVVPMAEEQLPCIPEDVEDLLCLDASDAAPADGASENAEQPTLGFSEHDIGIRMGSLVASASKYERMNL